MVGEDVGVPEVPPAPSAPLLLFLPLPLSIPLSLPVQLWRALVMVVLGKVVAVVMGGRGGGRR